MFKIKLFILSYLFISLNVMAVTSTLGEALVAKAKIEDGQVSLEEASESIILEISLGLDQFDSSLCWSFSTLSGLEARYMVKASNSKPLFSRAAMQRNNALERGKRSYIFKTDRFMERGVFVNGLELVEKYGLIPYSSRELSNVSDYRERIRKDLSAMASASQEQKIVKIESLVDEIFFPLPRVINFEGNSQTPKELGNLIKGKDKWIAYRFDGAEGSNGYWNDHPDSDAMAGTRAWTVHQTKKEIIIKEGLKAGFPVEMSFAGHSVLIYGADYDQAGRALKYYIKDSYMHGGDFTYTSNARRTHQELWELSTKDLRTEINR